MKWTSACCGLLLAISGAATAQVNALPQARHILVYGDAEARAIPDRFKIVIDFESTDMKADVARRRVEGNLRDTIAKLKANGVGENEIVATSLSIGPVNEYDERVRKEVFKGIEVKRSLTARFADQARLQAFLAQLETSKDVQISDITTGLSDEVALRTALRQKAIDASREKAETMAGAYGVRLAGLYSVSDVAPQFRYGIEEGSWPSRYDWSRNGDGSTSLDRIEVTGSRIKRSDVESIQTGYVTFTDKIYAVFLISD